MAGLSARAGLFSAQEFTLPMQFKNLSLSRRPNLALLFLLSLLIQGVLASCTNPDETPLSDDEKIRRANKGRADYQKSMQNGEKPGAGAPNGG